MDGAADLRRRAIEDPDGFWLEAAQAIDWAQPPTMAGGGTPEPGAPWFADGILNTAHNALDRHVAAGRGDQLALIYDSPVTDTVARFTYSELRDEVARLAGAMRALGVGKGDRVLLYMPMVPEVVFGMLACARLGAIHSVVFGGFAANELAVRVEDARPKLLLTASCGIEGARVIPYQPLVEEALARSAHEPDARIVLQRPQLEVKLRDRDLDWRPFVQASSSADCVDVAATDPLYILYTSGTTGKPKGVVRDNGGHAVALSWSMANVYDTGPGQVFWAASDCGWVVGHSYIVYAPLLVGATTVLYEGKPVGTPDPGAFWRVAAEHSVRALFTAPTAIRAIKREDHSGEHLARHDLEDLKYLFLAGERTDPDTYEWARSLLGVPVIDHWWQTETGWSISANLMGVDPLPIKAGSVTRPVPGYDVRILDQTGGLRPAGEQGSISIRLPLPPGCLSTLWEDEQGFLDSYMRAADGFYTTGDGGYIDEDGYLYVMGRTDDVINVAGHRLSTGGIEEVVAAHPDVAECAVIGVADELKGQLPEVFAVLKAGVSTAPDVVGADLMDSIRGEIGPIATPRDVHVVARLPKTRSGKVLRATMRKIADGEEYQVPPTIDDPAILDEIRDALASVPGS